MDTADLKHYLADAPPTIVRLEIEKHFEPLSDKQKRYAHFISRYVSPPILSPRPGLTSGPEPPSLAPGWCCAKSRLSLRPSMT